MEEVNGPPFELWPDNIMATNVFISLGTQWRLGMSGAIGLDYVAAESVMRMLDIRKKARPAILHDLRIMEDAALETMRETEARRAKGRKV